MHVQYLAVIVVFCGRNGKFAAAKFAPFPQFTANFIIFHETILVFTIFEPKWFFEVIKFRKSASPLSFTSHNRFKSASLFLTDILEAAQPLPYT